MGNCQQCVYKPFEIGQQRQEVSQDLPKLQQRKVLQDMVLKGAFLLITVPSLETHSWPFIEFEAFLTGRRGQHPEPLAYLYRRGDVKRVSPHCLKICAPLLIISQVNACCALGACVEHLVGHMEGLWEADIYLVLCTSQYDLPWKKWNFDFFFHPIWVNIHVILWQVLPYCSCSVCCNHRPGCDLGWGSLAMIHTRHCTPCRILPWSNRNGEFLNIAYKRCRST